MQKNKKCVQTIFFDINWFFEISVFQITRDLFRYKYDFISYEMAVMPIAKNIQTTYSPEQLN